MMIDQKPSQIYSSTPDDQSPVLSIVTLCYNTGRYVVEGMSALLPQLSDQVEHVILDDGSADGSVKLILDYAHSVGYPVRLYANRSNCGITESKSRILKLARGAFIAGSADDVFLPDRLAHDLRIIENLPSEAAGFYSLALPFRVDSKGEKVFYDKPIGEISGVQKPKLIGPLEILDRLRGGNFIPAMCVCLRSEIYQEIPQDTSFFIEDYPMWVNLARAGWGLEYSPVVTTLYRRADHSVQKTNSLDVDFDILRVNTFFKIGNCGFLEK